MSDVKNGDFGLYIGGNWVGVGNDYRISYVPLSEVNEKSSCMIVNKIIKIVDYAEPESPFAMYNRGLYSLIPGTQGYGIWEVLEDYKVHHFEIATVLGVEDTKWLLLSGKKTRLSRFYMRRTKKDSMALFGVQRGDQLVLELTNDNNFIKRVMCNLGQERLLGR